MSRFVTLVLAVGLAVVGVAGAASAHHNTISGTVACASGGGWAVTWTVVNSEARTERITASNRPGVVPVDTQLTASQTRTFAEAVTTRPTSPVVLTLSARWSNGVTNTSSGSIPVADFSDGCNVTTVQPPTIPVVDDCGPGNARYGEVPAGPWTSVANPDGSVTVTADEGHRFPRGTRRITYPAPTDSNEPCPPPPAPPAPPAPPVPPQPTVVTPPVVTPAEVLPVEALVVSARARKIDKCGTSGDVYKVVKRPGVVYTSKGKVLRQGVWLKARGKRVAIRAHAEDASYRLEGKRVWRMSFRTRPCAQAPEVAPATGQR